MEDDLNFFEKGRRPNFLENVRQPQKQIMQPTTIKSKNNGCGTAPGNLVFVFFGFVFCVLLRSSLFSCVRDVPYTTQACSKILLQNRSHVDHLLIRGTKAFQTPQLHSGIVLPDFHAAIASLYLILVYTLY